MKGETSIKYLATKIGQLELEKSILLGQLEELHEIVEQLKKEVESWQRQPKKDGESDT